MITVTGEAQLEAWRSRALPPVERLAGGIWSVPVPIPQSPLRYTLSYLIPGDDGLVVVDPGWDSAEGWAALHAGLSAAGATTGDVRGVVVTHVHSDHHGLSKRLQDLGAWVAMHPAERDALHPGGSPADWLRAHHVPEDEIAALAGTIGQHRLSEPAQPDVLLQDGDPIPLAGRTVTTVWTPGHTPGHICLLEPAAGVLLTGDHLLPRISPNIGLQRPGSSPLESFLESLDRVAKHDELEAFPAHEYRFRGIAARSRQLREHHEARCDEIVATVAALGAPTIWTLAASLTWSRPWAEIGPMRVGAVAETMAHVRYLADRGALHWSGETVSPASSTS
ncbi:Zn-dependent hydrolase [Actinoplanes sp. SE50]|uniref:MBL fold metallo-hydrolase n=1 Tax=unclassified Actinoplanes TaxID=2626549 RepID=UPI00023ECF04|nr:MULTISPECIES: MBL fold metallo-hydrolase [unclassified Actinoplanes]AEV86072.1 Hydroxyacylglutathione hydrolase [Actinoplanes sp. SE50/110]ATO84470.1 Zn-dependent hydrolase [Actinoplanes sp. SE50]SLM01880.1 Zn-dependent hydrolase [Actinoplanes sp. SE50/110]